ncbi:MAG: hypothetical protein EBY17_31020 [Acidobacteriia bacterium]|nr:hypothetical protein [Terriglobia bacterium]
MLTSEEAQKYMQANPQEICEDEYLYYMEHKGWTWEQCVSHTWQQPGLVPGPDLDCEGSEERWHYEEGLKAREQQRIREIEGRWLIAETEYPLDLVAGVAAQLDDPTMPPEESVSRAILLVDACGRLVKKTRDHHTWRAAHRAELEKIGVGARSHVDYEEGIRIITGYRDNTTKRSRVEEYFRRYVKIWRFAKSSGRKFTGDALTAGISEEDGPVGAAEF